MEGDESKTKDSRPTHKELHQVDQLERPPGHLADADAGTKTFHMAPKQDLGWPDGYDSGDQWPVYEPFTGLRTAAVLGGLMLLVLIYILYKTRCGGRIGRRRWTSKDRLFVERYKRKVQERYILDASTRYRRREFVRTPSHNVDAVSTDKPVPPPPVTVQLPAGAELRPPGQNDTANRHRRRHHSVNEAITHLDVRVPLRIGEEAGRRRHARPTTAAADGGGQQGRPAAVAVVVEECQSADKLDRSCERLLLLPSAVPLVDVAARRTGRGRPPAAAAELRRFGRRCRSLDNVLNASNTNTAAVQLTSVLTTTAN